MSLPKVEILPIKPAVRSDAAVTLDVLIRITPPIPQKKVNRPPLNLGLVLDRSGSMDSENKLPFAREAAVFAVQQLAPSDRVSVTVFDDKVQTLAPNRTAENKAYLVEILRAIRSGGSTDLHGGWNEGAKQVGSNLVVGGLNRVILLSDGQANAGQTDPDAIATDVHTSARAGVGTTTIGLGSDYNEKLLESMANSGDGNYYFVESPGQLPGIFERELKELMGLTGNTVSLGLEPQGSATVAEVLNDLVPLPSGRFPLPNLIVGMPISFVLRLNVPAQAGEKELLRVRLAWNEPKSTTRRELFASLKLPAVPAVVWDSLAEDEEVRERAALLQIARWKKEASEHLALGDRASASQKIELAKTRAASEKPTPDMVQEAGEIVLLQTQLEDHDDSMFTKKATSQAHARRRSKPVT